ncbi:hypothetical protein BDZ91DRAFT_793854 [Kalaharituber pfeilii]|nr:hypothetical protein BDZ91DRAFT_793854 [Kalaharituber pfeilii]
MNRSWLPNDPNIDPMTGERLDGSSRPNARDLDSYEDHVPIPPANIDDLDPTQLGLHHSELPNDPNVDPMDGTRYTASGVPIPRHTQTPASLSSRSVRLQIPDISRLGLDSPYELHSPTTPGLRSVGLEPNYGFPYGLGSAAQSREGFLQYPGGPPDTKTAPSRSCSTRTVNTDATEARSSSYSQSSRSVSQSMKSVASAVGSVVNSVKGSLSKNAKKRRRKRENKKKQKDAQKEMDSEEEEDDGGAPKMSPPPEPHPANKYRKDKGPPPPPAAAVTLNQRGGSAPEVLAVKPCYINNKLLYEQIHNSEFLHQSPPMQPRSAVYDQSPQSLADLLTWQPVLTPNYSSPAKFGLSQGPVTGGKAAGNTVQETLPEPKGPGIQLVTSAKSGPHVQALSKKYPDCVKDVNSGLSTQEDILPGKLVRVKYWYEAKEKDEFDLVLGDLLVVLLTISDGWALGSRYPETLDYISSREEVLAPPAEVSEKRSATKGTPLMKFFPLEAVQLVQGYEWSFIPATSTCFSLRSRSTLNTTCSGGVSNYHLHNPPLRGVSRRPTLIYGENKRMVELGYDRFVAEVLQKLIEEGKYSMRRIQEDASQTVAKEDIPLASPTSSCWATTSPTDSEWTYSSAISPISPTSIGSARSPVELHSIASLMQVTSPVAESTQQTSVAVVEANHSSLQVPVTEAAAPPEVVADKEAEVMGNTIEKKVQKRHILKESLRWATKRKQKILRAIRKEKDAKAIDENQERLVAEMGRDFYVARRVKPPLPVQTEIVASGKAVEGKDLFTGGGSPRGMPGRIDPITGLWDFTAPGGKEASRVSRPSVHDIFISENCTRNPKLPVPRMTSPESGDEDEINPVQKSPGPKASLPKLSIVTQTTGSQVPLDKKVLNEAPARKQSLHDWYRGKVNSPTSKSTEVSPGTGGGVAMDEAPVRGRGRERKNSTCFASSEPVPSSPTCTKEWAARGLIEVMVKRARHSMRGKYAAAGAEEQLGYDDYNGDTDFSPEELFGIRPGGENM